MVEFHFTKRLQRSHLQLYWWQTLLHSSSSNFQNVQNNHFVDTCNQLLPLFCNLYLLRWQHWEMTSDHLRNNISSGASTMSNFLCQHELRLLELGLYDLHLPFTFQNICGWSFLFVNFQCSVDNFVSFLFFSTLKDFLWSV